MIFAAFLNSAYAEYRAFELVISNETTGQERTVISTLDPLQYRYYYPVRAEETVKYRATWMCKGNTSHHLRICAQPEGQNPQPLQNSGPNTNPQS